MIKLITSHTCWNNTLPQAPNLYHLQTTNKVSIAVANYRSLMTLRSQSQHAANLLAETAQIANGDLIQPLRERFKAAIDTSERMLQRIPEKGLQQKARERYEAIRTIGLGDINEQNDPSGMFQMMGAVFQEKNHQNTYLAGNNRIVQVLSQQTEKLIEEIQSASSGTSDIFAQAISHRRNEFFAMILSQ